VDGRGSGSDVVDLGQATSAANWAWRKNCGSRSAAQRRQRHNHETGRGKIQDAAEKRSIASRTEPWTPRKSGGCRRSLRTLAVQDSLAELGWKVDHNLIINYRWPAGKLVRSCANAGSCAGSKGCAIPDQASVAMQRLTFLHPAYILRGFRGELNTAIWHEAGKFGDAAIQSAAGSTTVTLSERFLAACRATLQPQNRIHSC
jgi:hypothetical protein